jgi:hypothetical protein
MLSLSQRIMQFGKKYYKPFLMSLKFNLLKLICRLNGIRKQGILKLVAVKNLK